MPQKSIVTPRLQRMQDMVQARGLWQTVEAQCLSIIVQMSERPLEAVAVASVFSGMGEAKVNAKSHCDATVQTERTEKSDAKREAAHGRNKPEITEKEERERGESRILDLSSEKDGERSAGRVGRDHHRQRRNNTPDVTFI
ncbi:hypothetical protein Q5P01_014876 [Channa striata]|uniref:Uncharacterized protein n=1 Tax=Channa striata TaxID=64152 RepID=A0AA88MGP2_CHASR|nr:hypothetical protein Q5P01_014876 [Channa striata]